MAKAKAAEAPELDPEIRGAVEVQLRHIDTLIPYANNARTHSSEQVAQLAAAIEEFGFTNPLIADEQGVVAGHGRLLAVRQLMKAGRQIRTPAGVALPAGHVPVIDCSGWSEPKRRAYILWDNQSAALAGWDNELLKLELGELAGVDYDLHFTGFSTDFLGELGFGDISGGSGGGLSDNYSRKIEAPIYRITGEKPAVADLLDETKTIELQDEIEAAELPDDVREFLLAAAERHTVFNFRNIAEFYAHADAPLQRLMERSALVIIDFNQAIENGFVRLSEGMMEQAELSKAKMAERDAA